MKRNTAGQSIGFLMLDINGDPVTTGTPVVSVSLDNGSQGAGGGSSTHKGNGVWHYLPTQSETNVNHLSVLMTLTDAISQSLNVYPIAVDEYKANVTGMSTLDAAGVRSAVGLSAANLDAQVGAVLTTSDFNTRLSATRAGHIDKLNVAGTLANTDNANTFKADTTGLSTLTAAGVRTELTPELARIDANISSRSTFAGGAVASVTNPVTVGTNNDKTGYSLTQGFPANFAALGINGSGHVSRVVQVDTTTVNADMRGTDNALLAASYTAPANSDVTAIKSQTDKLDFTGTGDALKSESTNMRGTDDALTTLGDNAPNGWITANSIASGAFTAAKFAADWFTSLIAAIWTDATSRSLTDKEGYSLTSAYDAAKTAASPEDVSPEINFNPEINVEPTQLSEQSVAAIQQPILDEVRKIPRADAELEAGDPARHELVSGSTGIDVVQIRKPE